MLPLRFLTQNLLYDFSQLAIPFDRSRGISAEPAVEDRRHRHHALFGPVSSVSITPPSD